MTTTLLLHTLPILILQHRLIRAVKEGRGRGGIYVFTLLRKIMGPNIGQTRFKINRSSCLKRMPRLWGYSPTTEGGVLATNSFYFDTNLAELGTRNYRKKCQKGLPPFTALQMLV